MFVSSNVSEWIVVVERNSKQPESQSHVRVSLSASQMMELRAPIATGSAEDDPLAKNANVRRSE